MNQMKPIQSLHPNQDGADRQENFLYLLREAIRSVSRDGEPVGLQSVQSALLRKGWHP
jgi:hypothetical protein